VVQNTSCKLRKQYGLLFSCSCGNRKSFVVYTSAEPTSKWFNVFYICRPKFAEIHFYSHSSYFKNKEAYNITLLSVRLPTSLQLLLIFSRLWDHLFCFCLSVFSFHFSAFCTVRVLIKDSTQLIFLLVMFHVLSAIFLQCKSIKKVCVFMKFNMHSVYPIDSFFVTEYWKLQCFTLCKFLQPPSTFSVLVTHQSVLHDSLS
jgi:hypothetical protein